MTPTTVLTEAMLDLLAADTATLASVLANKLKLAAAPFVPSEDLLVGDLTEATFTGSAGKSITPGAQTVFVDPTDGLRTIELLEPIGGFHFQCTVDPGAPETIYGYFVTDNAGTTLLATALFPEPIVIQAAGEGLDVPYAHLKLQSEALV